MLEDEAFKFLALHLEGISHEFWHHGMVALEHNQVTLYAEFIEVLMDHFDGGIQSSTSKNWFSQSSPD